MSTVLEIHNLFTQLRSELQKEHEADQKKLGKGQEDKKAKAETLWLFTQMGLFVGESLVVDIKRIADALDGGDGKHGISASLYELTMNTQSKG